MWATANIAHHITLQRHGANIHAKCVCMCDDVANLGKDTHTHTHTHTHTYTSHWTYHAVGAGSVGASVASVVFASNCRIAWVFLNTRFNTKVAEDEYSWVMGADDGMAESEGHTCTGDVGARR